MGKRAVLRLLRSLSQEASAAPLACALAIVQDKSGKGSPRVPGSGRGGPARLQRAATIGCAQNLPCLQPWCPVAVKLRCFCLARRRNGWCYESTVGAPSTCSMQLCPWLGTASSCNSCVPVAAGRGSQAIVSPGLTRPPCSGQRRRGSLPSCGPSGGLVWHLLSSLGRAHRFIRKGASWASGVSACLCRSQSIGIYAFCSPLQFFITGGCDAKTR